MRIAANLNFFFTDLPLLDRYAKVAEAGFKLVELPLPYSEPAEELKKAADKHGIRHVLINGPAGDWDKGNRGLAALAGREQEYKEGIAKAIHYAKTLECNRIHVMAGIITPEVCCNEVYDLYRTNIELAAASCLKENITVLIEPINNISIPGYYLNSYPLAARIIEDIALPNLKLQFDTFHAQQICGKLTHTAQKYKNIIDYIQVAQVPIRHEPSFPGEIDYSYVFKMLNDMNPEWYVGCEYNPSPVGLSWVMKYGLKF